MLVLLLGLLLKLNSVLVLMMLLLLLLRVEIFDPLLESDVLDVKCFKLFLNLYKEFV